MNKSQLLETLEKVLRNNIGSKLTDELASGLYATINQLLDMLKIEEEKNNGESTNSK